MLRSFPALAALTMISLAWAQLAWAQEVPTAPEILPTPAETLLVPSTVDISPGQPAPAASSVSQRPVALPGVSGTLNVARTVSGAVPLTIAVRAGGTPFVIGVRRDNTQNCSFGPLVRVGTQEVVYPAAGSQKRLCTQEIVTKSTAASGAASFSRVLKVPPGEYMVESWLTGLVNGVLVKVPATPVRITVK